MNIFYLDNNPKIAATYHTDIHVRKMTLETAQILHTVLFKLTNHNIYKPTHEQHPCTIWAQESLNNYRWLVALGFALSEEYEYRFGKIHKSHPIIVWANHNEPNCFTKIKLTKPAQAMPLCCRQKNTVQAYRSYYNRYKRHLFSWTKRDTPYWITYQETIDWF